MKKHTTNLYGLVLTGGRSSRLGKDKYLIEYHGVSQVRYLYDMLVSLGLQTFISCNKAQENNLKQQFPLIVDQYEEIGPMGALSAAFDVKPGGGWLVVACDLPFINEKTIRNLIEARSVGHILTTYQDPKNDFFETTISIYEPPVNLVMKNAYMVGEYSLRRAIDYSQIKVIQPTDLDELFNANTQEAVDFAMAKIKQY